MNIAPIEVAKLSLELSEYSTGPVADSGLFIDGLSFGDSYHVEFLGLRSGTYLLPTRQYRKPCAVRFLLFSAWLGLYHSS